MAIEQNVHVTYEIMRLMRFHSAIPKVVTTDILTCDERRGYRSRYIVQGRPEDKDPEQLPQYPRRPAKIEQLNRREVHGCQSCRGGGSTRPTSSTF